MRGGADHDAMHGAAGNDLMNGDCGGDYLFGDDGVDVMWGGQGRACSDPSDLACNSDRGIDDALRRLPVRRHTACGPTRSPAAPTSSTSGHGRASIRLPGSSHDTRDADPIADHQHHQGIDWIYGGWDRDVMQADVADNGPNPGDRLLDWTGGVQPVHPLPIRVRRL